MDHGARAFRTQPGAELVQGEEEEQEEEKEEGWVEGDAFRRVNSTEAVSKV